MADAQGSSNRWRAYVPPNRHNKFPWRWRWIGVPLLLAAFVLGGWWAWGRAENQLGERALAHLACEGIDTSELDLDWSYRSVKVDGQLPTGVTASQVEQVIDQGSTNTSCLADAGIDADDDPGVYDVEMLAAAAAAPIAEPQPTAVPEPTVEAEPTAAPEPTATAEPEPSPTPEPEPTAAAEPSPEPVIAALNATAEFDGDTITLSGLVGSDEQREALVAAATAAVGADNVTDNLRVDDGEPSDTSAVRIDELGQTIAAFGSPNVLSGTASISDADLTYEVEAPTDNAKSSLDLPGSGTVTVPEAAEPAFTG